MKQDLYKVGIGTISESDNRSGFNIDLSKITNLY